MKRIRQFFTDIHLFQIARSIKPIMLYAPFIYQWLHTIHQKNHEKKISYKIFASFLIMFGNACTLTLLINDTYHKFLVPTANTNPIFASVLAEAVSISIVNTTIQSLRGFENLHPYNSFLLYLFSIGFVYLGARYFKLLGVYNNENLVSEKFHNVVHYYRDFVDSIEKEKGKSKIYRSVDITKQNMKAYYGLLDQYRKSAHQIVTRASELMRDLTRDPQGFCEYYFIVKETSQKLHMEKISHTEDSIRSSTAYDLTIDRNRASIYFVHPKNVFQYIYSLYENAPGNATWKLGQIFTDLKGHMLFLKMLSPGERYPYGFRSSIVVPISINKSIKGFLSYNSKRIGLLREKHRNVLSAHVDLLANTYRKIFEIQDALFAFGEHSSIAGRKKSTGSKNSSRNGNKKQKAKRSRNKKPKK